MTYKTKRCEVCGQYYAPNSPTQKYCMECRVAGRKAQNAVYRRTHKVEIAASRAAYRRAERNKAAADVIIRKAESDRATAAGKKAVEDYKQEEYKRRMARNADDWFGRFLMVFCWVAAVAILGVGVWAMVVNGVSK